MSFTAAELRLLQIADQVEGSCGVPGRARGRPRTRPDTPQVQRQRDRQLRYLHGLPPPPDLSRGGRPRAPYVDAKTERRRERHRRYWLRRRERQQQHQGNAP